MEFAAARKVVLVFWLVFFSSGSAAVFFPPGFLCRAQQGLGLGRASPAAPKLPDPRAEGAGTAEEGQKRRLW